MGREIIGTEIRDYILRLGLLQRLFPNLRRKGDMEGQEKYMSEKYFSAPQDNVHRIEPAVRPDTIFFWNKTAKTIKGRELVTTPAAIKPHGIW